VETTSPRWPGRNTPRRTLVGDRARLSRHFFPGGHLEDPAEIRYSAWAYWLLGFYIVHGVVIMLLLRIRQESTPSFRLLGFMPRT